MEEKVNGQPKTQTLKSPHPHAAFDVEGGASGAEPLSSVP